MTTIVPAVLAKDITTFEEEMRIVERFAGKVQMDIVDGKFSTVETVIPESLLGVETTVEVEAHLMVYEPLGWVERCVATGVTAIYGQVEKMTDKQEFITTVEEAGLRVGLAYDLETPLTGLDEWVSSVDAVLLMAVTAGVQGQVFDERVLEKIKKVRELSSVVLIVVDGGLNEENIRKCLNVGGEKMEFAVGSEILKADDPDFVYRKLEAIS